MDVFLVPVGADTHALYCELPIDTPPISDGGSRASWWRRRLDRFRQLLAEAEEERRRRERGQPVQSRGMWRWTMRKVAEAIAEQRLLWILRRATSARLIHPADLTQERAVRVVRETLQRDFEKHRRWLVINALLMLLCVPLTIIPGPNVPALYFTFRAVGHYLSMRGARQGLGAIEWTCAASTDLMSVRQALRLDPSERRARIDDLSASLGLDRLGAFVDRVAS